MRLRESHAGNCARRGGVAVSWGWKTRRHDRIAINETVRRKTAISTHGGGPLLVRKIYYDWRKIALLIIKKSVYTNERMFAEGYDGSMGYATGTCPKRWKFFFDIATASAPPAGVRVSRFQGQ